jgi:holo-[acyl-carrier protein] synthase
VIYGIGTDIVRIQRMADNLGRYGERFAARILTEQEMAVFRESAQQAPFLAKRFAAKEAAAKALGTGFRGGLSLRDIGVDNDALGKPVLAFSEHARQVLQNRGVGHTHLSLSDESEYAIAYVVLEADRGESQ